ncbi:MAG: hypothetical protein HQK94_18810 [Nitrospirae bacterium]|nr:hypothetical protein [Nitrospirota bacterium]
MESIVQFFRHNMDHVFLVYGFAFMSMGVAISVLHRTDGQFKLSKVIWLLSSFAVLHGINEWIDMLILTHPPDRILNIASFIGYIQ